MKFIVILLLTICWLSAFGLCDDDEVKKQDDGSDDDSKAIDLGIATVECGKLSNAVYEDAQHLLNVTLAKEGTVKIKDDKKNFIVAYGTAAAVTKPKGEEKTITHSQLRVGIQAVMDNCKMDDGKIDGFYKLKDESAYRICLTAEEETDDC